ncbi:MAG: T9SS type A sorting domain-containing protein [Lentimicrobiaceae bacterium]|nr:T9SS type A sorting domain-containing protein [Lentimicrobiaceae bacterium]
MKKFIIICFIFTGIITISAFAQQYPTREQIKKHPLKYKVDYRIDNMAYWKRMANLGLVTTAPIQKVPKAIFTGNNINSKSVLTTNSLDVCITSENSTQSENSVFISPLNPDNALNSNNSTPLPAGSVYGADHFITNDEGNTWDGSIYGAGGGDQGDPTTAIGNNGHMFVGFIHSNNGQGVSHSTDGGTTWTSVVVAPGPPGWNSLLDKNHLWIDNSTTSVYDGNLYDAWTNFGGSNNNQIEISRSTDDGLTWSAPQSISNAVSAGSHNQGVNISTGPDGQVYVCWVVYDAGVMDEKAIGFTRSTDGGVTYQPAIRAINNLKGIRTGGTSKNMRVNSFPSMTVDISNSGHRGTIYIVWANKGVPGINTGSDIDVYLIKSTDGGTTWSNPKKINTDAPGAGKQHYFPWITCDPITGTLSVIFYDDRNVTSSQCEVWCANSYDGGETWADFKVSDIAFTPTPIPGLASSYFGDYLAISARNGQVYPVWTDNRSGHALTYASPYVTGMAPVATVFPIPVDSSKQVLPFTKLHWQDTSNVSPATLFKIYLGTDNPPTNIVSGGMVMDTVFIPSHSLPENSTIYWRVDAYNGFGNTSGNVWSFTTLPPVEEDFESGDFTRYQWNFNEQPWTVTNLAKRNGGYSAKSGIVNVGDTSAMHLQLELAVTDTLHFWVKTTTMETVNHLEFAVDGQVMETWSGTLDWTQAAIPVTAGLHNYEWRYVKTAQDTTIIDAVWVDYIDFPMLSPITAVAGNDDDICVGQTYQLNGSSVNYSTVQWTTSGNGTFNNSGILNPVYTPGSIDITQGFAKLVLTVTCGCGDVLSDTLILSIHAIPSAFTIQGGGGYCEGGSGVSISLNGSQTNIDYELLLNNTPTGYILPGTGSSLLFENVTVPGTYKIKAANAYGCERAMTGQVSVLLYPLPVVQLGSDTIICVNHVIELDATIPNAQNYLWQPFGQTTPTIMVDSTGVGAGVQTYSVLVTDNNGCQTTDDITITFDPCTGITGYVKGLKVDISPNPASENVYLTLITDKNCQFGVKITNAANQEFYHQRMTVNGKMIKTIDISSLARGIYFVHIEGNKTKLIRKLIVQ